ncbi:MAG: folate-binding protein [Opitutaceae bacterium]|nr:folate-binding protein [Opitutaceae bacterium]
MTGEDALTFLQGQFTQELRSTATAPVAYGLWLNQKGKVLADSFILREALDSVWIISFSSSAQVICERLEAYVIADDVVIEDATEEWSGITVGGREAEDWLKRETGGVPACGEFFKVAEGGWVFRGRRGSETSFDCIRPADAPVPAGLAMISPEALERMRISAGIPRVPQDIGIGDLPNEGGLDEPGISYTKGCYLGQEVMARLKAMGTVRRRLVRVRGAGRGVPAVPCALLQGEKRAGELRSAVADGAGGFIGLAMITKLGLDPMAKLAPEPGGDGFIELVELP